ncbi:putative nuclease HARBI1 isoform X2 [Tanacetum coccineum]
MDSREGSEVLIVCIGNRETAQRHYMGNSNEWIINTPLLWANNDLNVLYGSPLFDDELADTAPECPFVFKRVQEAARKDIERAFGVLQGRWRIIRQLARAYQINILKK